MALVALGGIGLALVAGAGPADAHAVFTCPTDSSVACAAAAVAPDVEQALILSVPNERTDADGNVAVDINVPDGWQARSCLPQETWTCTAGFEAGEGDRPDRQVVRFHKADGAARADDETFRFTVLTAANPGAYPFLVNQTYRGDPEPVRWNGEGGSARPAPGLSVLLPGTPPPPPPPPTTRPAHDHAPEPVGVAVPTTQPLPAPPAPGPAAVPAPAAPGATTTSTTTTTTPLPAGAPVPGAPTDPEADHAHGGASGRPASGPGGIETAQPAGADGAVTITGDRPAASTGNTVVRVLGTLFVVTALGALMLTLLAVGGIVVVPWIRTRPRPVPAEVEAGPASPEAPTPNG
jgi:hypothetical protein